MLVRFKKIVVGNVILWRGIALIQSEFRESMPNDLQLKIRQLYNTPLSDDEAIVAAQDVAGFFNLLHKIYLKQSHDLKSTDSAHSKVSSTLYKNQKRTYDV